jgi:hypothetical protein
MEKAGRNEPCPCGSGKKFKKCCESKAAKKVIGTAEIITGPNKMSSLFNRFVAPPPQPKDPPKDET